MKIVAERLKDLRLNCGYTMEMVVADIKREYGVKLQRAHLSKWENGVNLPSIYAIYVLSNYYHVSADYLIGLTDCKAPADLLAKVRRKKGA